MQKGPTNFVYVSVNIKAFWAAEILWSALLSTVPGGSETEEIRKGLMQNRLKSF